MGTKNEKKKNYLPIKKMVENVARLLGCGVRKLPNSYLGLPLDASFKSSVAWDAVEEKLRKRSIMRKRQYLANYGRLTLTKSTLSSSPIYFMSLLLFLER